VRVNTEALSVFRHLTSYVFAGIMAPPAVSAVDGEDTEAAPGASEGSVGPDDAVGAAGAYLQ